MRSLTLWQVGQSTMYASMWALMRGHQTCFCRANSIFSDPKWPLNALSCSSQSKISRKSPIDASTSTSESFSTQYKVGCSLPPCNRKCPSWLWAHKIKGASSRSECWQCDTQGSQPGSRTTVCRWLNASGTTASQPGWLKGYFLSKAQRSNHLI